MLTYLNTLLGPYQYSMPQEQGVAQSPLFSHTTPAAYPQYSEPTVASLVSADSGKLTVIIVSNLFKGALRSDFTPLFYLLIAIYRMKK